MKYHHPSLSFSKNATGLEMILVRIFNDIAAENIRFFNLISCSKLITPPYNPPNKDYNRNYKHYNPFEIVYYHEILFLLEIILKFKLLKFKLLNLGKIFNFNLIVREVVNVI